MTELTDVMNENLSISQIVAGWQTIKRNGETVDFDYNRVINAIDRCFRLSCNRADHEAAQKAKIIAKRVINVLSGQGVSIWKVEEIQDYVIKQLWAEEEFEAAKKYTIYREDRRKQRIANRISTEVLSHIEEDKKKFKEPIQYFQFLDKFARWREEDKRREVWTESCDRVFNWFKTLPKVNLRDDEWAMLREYMFELKASPAMRVVQMAGPALERCNVGGYNCATLAIKDIFSFCELLYILMQGSGVGFSVENFYTKKLPKIKKQKKNFQKPTYIIPDTTEGWCDALHVGLTAWFNGEDVDFDASQIRAKGTKLKTKGGRASGKDPLMNLLKFARNIILSAQGRCLTSLECHDIACFVGEIVQVGGVRRSSCISLSDFSDVEMRNAKSGNWYENHVYRRMANNSAVYETKPEPLTFMREWLALGESGSGERGIFNRQAIRKLRPKRRKNWRFQTNPCFHPDTRIATSNGLVKIGDLYQDGNCNLVVSDNRVSYSATDYSVANGQFGTQVHRATQVELTGENLPIYQLQTEHGYKVTCTSNHKFFTPDGAKELKDLKVNDMLLLQSGVGCFGTRHSFDEGFLLGLVVGDGSINQESVWLDLYEKNFAEKEEILEAVNLVITNIPSYNNRDYGKVSWCNQVSTVPKIRTGGKRLARWMGTVLGIEVLTDAKRRVPECVWQGSKEFVRGYLQGLFYTDGTVNVAGKNKKQTVCLRLCQANLLLLEDVQVVLQNFGIVSRIYLRKQADMKLLPDGKGGHREYQCQDYYELVINRPNCILFEQKIGLQGRKGKRLAAALAVRGRDCRKEERYVSKVKSIVEVGNSDVFCLNQMETHNICVNGLVASNCGEIILRPNQFCNLSIAVARPDDTPSSLEKKVIVATYFGCMQKTATKFGYIRDEWKKNSEEESLIGVDINGQMDCPLLRPGAPGRKELLNHLRDVVRKVDQELSARFGVNESAANTTVKPSGDSSEFFQCSPGVHVRYSRYQVRTCRVADDNPVGLMLRDQGLTCHDETGPTGKLRVIEFLKEAPAKCPTRDDMNAIEQLENWLFWQENWAEHSVSCSIYIDDHEWLEVGNWVYRNFDKITGLSFFPKGKTVYRNAPNQPLTEDEYHNRLAEFPDVNWSKLAFYEDEDMTGSSKEYACTGGSCSML